MRKIKEKTNIVFDLGGVLLNIDQSKSISAFKHIGLTKEMFTETSLDSNGLFNLFEMGKITPEEFRASLRNKIDGLVSDLEIDDAWNAMLIDFPESRINLLFKLQKTNNIYLLSNTNYIHHKYFTELIKSKFNINLDSCFKQVFYSHKMGLRKPSVEIFNQLIAETGIDASDTVFIDDLLDNTLSAEKAGMLGYHLNLNIMPDVCQLFSSDFYK